MTTTAPSSTPQLSLIQFADAFYDVTSTSACAYNDRYFFRERVKWLERNQGVDLQLPCPKLGDPSLIDSVWMIYDAANIVFDRDPSTKREIAAIHNLVKRLVPALQGGAR